MSWVTLSLRKKELKRTHADYVMRDLEIAREERQMSRRYQYEQTLVQNDQQEELRDLRNSYRDIKSNINNQISEFRKELSDTNITDDYKQQLYAQIAELQSQLETEKENYEYSTNEVQTYWEDELELIENEANDTETMYEEEKVNIETQMEVVAQELQAVSDALSNEIQQCTIKLS